MNFTQEFLQQVKDNAISEINFWLQDISDDERELLIEALKTNTSVTSIEWTLETDFAIKLAEVIKYKKTVTKVWLVGCDNGAGFIGDEAVKAWAEVLKTNHYLENFQASVSLRNESSCLRDLAKAANTNPNLAIFCVSGYWFNDEQRARPAKAICPELKDSKNLILVSPGTDKSGKLCESNEAIAIDLFNAIKSGASKLSIDELHEIKERLPAIKAVARDSERRLSEEEITKFLKPVKIRLESLDKPKQQLATPNVRSQRKKETVETKPDYTPKISPASIREQLKARSGVRLGLV